MVSVEDCVEREGTKVENAEKRLKCYIEDVPRPIVKTFAIEMEKQLRANDWKRGWNKSLSGFLIDELISNTGKLRGAINRKDTKEVIIRRAANIANFAMMLAENEGWLNSHPDGPLSSPEITEMHKNGTLCEHCGCHMGKPTGYLRLCEDCGGDQG